MKVYNKLVRDRIPEVIEGAGKKYSTHIAKKEEHLDLLEAKLEEEFVEYKEVKNIEELADLLEVIFGMARALGYTEEGLLRKRDEKREERGGFEKGVVLERVWEEKC